MPRFVLLLHHCPADRPRATHFDLMLEAGDTLRVITDLGDVDPLRRLFGERG